MMKTDVVIVGGGVTGLATGAMLAKAGYKTVVLEKGNQPGGRAYAYTEKGFVLNYGPHAVYTPESGLLSKIMRRIERPLPPSKYPDPMRAFWAHGDRFGAVGAKPHQTLTTSLFPPATRLAIGPLMLGLRMAKPERIAPEMTWGEWVDRKTKSRLLREWMRAFATVNTYTHPSADVGAAWIIAHMQRNVFAKDYAGYMAGGWGAMYDTFINALRANGGELITGARVEALEIDGGRMVAANAGGQRFEAQAFVCTLPPQEAPSIATAGTELEAELRRWSKLEDVRAICYDLGFSRRLRTDLTFIMDIDHTLYFSLHSEVTPGLAPEGGQLLHAMAYLSGEEAASETLTAERRACLEAGLDRFFAGWREAAVVNRQLVNTRVESVKRTPKQLANSVPLRSASVPNLYFAGDGRDVPYNLTDTCFVSSMEVADVIAAEYVAGVGVDGTVAPLTREPIGV